MINKNTTIRFILCLLVSISFHAQASTFMEDLNLTDAVQEIEPSTLPQAPIAEILAPLELLSSPIATEEISAWSPETDIKAANDNYQFQNPDLSVPARQTN